APRDHEHIRETRSDCLLDHVLDRRLVNDGEHLLRHRLRRGQKPRAQTRRRDDCLRDPIRHGARLPARPRLAAMTGDEGHQKRAMRADLRARRRNLTASERERATAAYAELLTGLVQSTGATSIVAYLP